MPHVLLISSDGESAAVIASALKDCFDAMPALTLAGNGREAVERMRACRYELILAEVQCLADLSDGTEEAVARLARLAAEALIVVVSEDNSVSAAVGAMRAGAHDYLAKPVTAATFAVRIASLCQRHGRPIGLRSPDADATRLPVTAGVPVKPKPSPAVVEDQAQCILPMWRQEQRIIEDAIARFSGNVAMAAAALQLSPSTLYRKRQAWAELAGERKGAA